MQITIVKDDNFVSIDGVQKEMDLSYLPDDFHALQFDGSKGSVESTDIDKCEKFDAITNWSGWTEFESKARAAKNAPTAADFDENIPEEDMSLSADPEPEPEQPIEPPTFEQIMGFIREVRYGLLEKSDIEIIKVLEMGQTVSSALKTYRQELRDVPNKIENGQLPKPVWNVEEQDVEFNSWPVKP